jgi:hypothetical protein
VVASLPLPKAQYQRPTSVRAHLTQWQPARSTPPKPLQAAHSEADPALWLADPGQACCVDHAVATSSYPTLTWSCGFVTRLGVDL